MGEDRLVEGGGPGEDADALLGDPPADRLDVEDRLGDDRGPGHEGGQQPGLVAEGVEEGVHHQVAVALTQAHDRGPGPEGSQRLAVGGHHPLGAARGARGEDEVAHVLRPHGERPRRRLGGVDGPGPGAELPPPDCGPGAAVPARQQDGLGQIAQVLAGEHVRVVDAEEAAHGEEQARPRGPQDVGGLPPLEPGVEGHQHRPGPEGPEGGHRPLPGVGRPERHPVTGPDARGHEGPGDPRRLRRQSGEGPADVAVDERLGVAEPVGHLGHEGRHRAPAQVGPRVLCAHRPTLGSGGRPSTRSPTMLRWISLEPP